MPKNTLKSTKKSTNGTISTKQHYKKMKKPKIHPNYRKKYGSDDRIECGIVVKFNKNHGPKWGTIIDAYGPLNDLVLSVQQLDGKWLDEKLPNLTHNCLNSRCVPRFHEMVKFKPDVYQIYIRDVLTITSFRIAFDICHHNCKRDKCNRCIMMNKYYECNCPIYMDCKCKSI
jgi:hypothetical protein